MFYLFFLCVIFKMVIICLFPGNWTRLWNPALPFVSNGWKHWLVSSHSQNEAQEKNAFSAPIARSSLTPRSNTRSGKVRNVLWTDSRHLCWSNMTDNTAHMAVPVMKSKNPHIKLHGRVCGFIEDFILVPFLLPHPFSPQTSHCGPDFYQDLAGGGYH